MSPLATAMPLACVALASDPPNNEASEADKTKIQGAWYTSSTQVDGQTPAEIYLTEPDLIFENESLILYGMRLGRFILDASKSPKTIDWIVDRGNGKGTTAGIYKIEDGVLTICLPGAPGQPRPDSFTSKKGSKRQLSVYKRKR